MKKDKIDENLEKVEYLNNENIDLVHKKWTGRKTVHWKEGEPMEEEDYTKKKIKLE